jgi:predicted cobalt transporter CbtA
MLTARSFLIRGLLAGLFAGIVAFGVAYIVGEPSVNAAIAMEESGTHDHGTEAAPADDHAAHEAAGPDTVVPRSLQSTAGLLTGTVVAGATLGGLVGVLSALALGRFGRAGVRTTTLTVAGIGFVSLYVLPFVAYPPNPPAVGQADTIVPRTALYFTMLAVSVVAALAAVVVGRRLTPTWGSWYAGLAVVGGYLVVTLLAIALLPAYNEVPAEFPATVLYQFRAASFVTQLTLWGVLGVTLAELLHRLGRRSGRLADAQQRYAGATTAA